MELYEEYNISNEGDAIQGKPNKIIMREQFCKAILDKTRIRLTFYSKEDSRELTRVCAPMDYGPSSRAKNNDDRYHLWDYESDSSNHVLSLLPDQIVRMDFTTINFEPSDFVTWTTKWFIKRDWGKFS